MARKKNYVSKRSVRSLRTPSNVAEVKDVECVSQQINNSALPVKRAVWVLPDYGGCYELYEGGEYLRFWIINVDGQVPKEFKIERSELFGQLDKLLAREKKGKKGK
jgi:hypothetical protein